MRPNTNDREEFLVVIPARLESHRLPQKIMANIHGEPMVYWTYRRALAANAGEVVVAVDCEDVADTLNKKGVNVVVTARSLENGTERVAAVADLFPTYQFFLNIQADEPLLSPLNVRVLSQAAIKDDTFYTAVTKTENRGGVSEVKVAMSHGKSIVYASRSAIPHNRDNMQDLLKIQGIYAYSRQVLNRFISSPIGPLESAERVEQLRCIENGIPIEGCIVNRAERSVDTQEDLNYVRSLPAQRLLDFK